MIDHIHCDVIKINPMSFFPIYLAFPMELYLQQTPIHNGNSVAQCETAMR